MKRKSALLLIAAGALASIATSPPRWHLSATAPAGMPTEATGSDGLLVTIEASAPPEVLCKVGMSPERIDREPVKPGTGLQYMCPPGSTLDDVTITGRGNAGCSKEPPKAPGDQFLRITKTERVPTWRETTEDTFEVGDMLSIRVESPRHPFVEVIDAGGAATRLSGFGENHFTINRSGSVHVRATVFGPCAPDCAKPADEPLRIERE